MFSYVCLIVSTKGCKIGRLKNNQKGGNHKKRRSKTLKGGELRSPRTLLLKYYTIIQKVHVLGIWEYKYVVVICLIEGQKYPFTAHL